MSAYKPFLFEDADEEKAPPDLPKSKDTPAKVIGHKLSFFRPCQTFQLEWPAAVR